MCRRAKFMSHICFNHNPFGGAFKCNLDYCADLRAASLGWRAGKMKPLVLSDWPIKSHMYSFFKRCVELECTVYEQATGNLFVEKIYCRQPMFNEWNKHSAQLGARRLQVNVKKFCMLNIALLMRQEIRTNKWICPMFPNHGKKMCLVVSDIVRYASSSIYVCWHWQTLLCDNDSAS